MDLYGPTIYPSEKVTARERYEWAKTYMESHVSDKRFRQFFSVHETEAWLLSDPDLFPAEVKNSLPGRIMNPESVNFREPPAKLLERLYQERANKTYKKITHGKELFDKLDPSVAYAKCPTLKEFLDEMLVMAKSALLL